MEKHQFKPFDQVLVRDHNDERWNIDFYICLSKNGKHKCMMSNWNQCIPYNENTINLVNNYDQYKEPEPKVWYVQCENTDGILLLSECYSDSELEKFLKNDLLQKKYKWVRIEYNQ